MHQVSHDNYEDFDFDFIECFTTTFLRAHSWLNLVDEEDTRYIKKITSK